MLRGIYSVSELQYAIESGQLDPQTAQFWKRGLSSWVSAGVAGFVKEAEEVVL